MCVITGCALDAQSGEPIAVVSAELPRGGDPVRGRDLLLNNGTESTPYLAAACRVAS